MIPCIVRIAGLKRSTKPTENETPAANDSRATCSTPARLLDRGFSTRNGTPASIALRHHFTWVSVGEAMTIASIELSLGACKPSTSWRWDRRVCASGLGAGGKAGGAGTDWGS